MMGMDITPKSHGERRDYQGSDVRFGTQLVSPAPPLFRLQGNRSPGDPDHYRITMAAASRPHQC